MTKQNKEKQNPEMQHTTSASDEKSSQSSHSDNAENKDSMANHQPVEPSHEEINEQQDPSNTLELKDTMIKTLQEKNEELNDRYLRLFSEFDNFRKRTLREKQELTKTASADLIEAILPVVDDLDRAYKSAIENPDLDTLTEGLGLIRTKLNTTLKHKGLEEIPSIGEVFDTDFHEAITHVPAPGEKEKGKVLDEVQKGYTLHGKVLRFAKVVVAN